MPIPQLSPRRKTGQTWRSQKKKYRAQRPRKTKKHTPLSPKFKLALKTKSKKAQSKLQAKRPNLKKRIQKTNKPRNLFKKLLRFFLALGTVGMLIGSLVGFLFFIRLSHSLPKPGSLIDREVAQTTKIFDRSGETVLYEIHGEEKRTLINLEDLPDYVKKATIAIEDKDFYEHKGFSVWAMFRTLVKNILTGQRAGGSTLTQQLIKNAIFTSEKTYTRKIKELIMAYRVEQKFTKDEILQMYLNEIPYGSTVYGIEAASQRYFGKSAQDLVLAEAAILAALPQAPSRYSPYGSNKELLIGRQQHILDLMVKYGYIPKEDAVLAKQFELEFKPPKERIIAPHFVMYVREKLSEKYGAKMIEEGGFKIYTTLDLYKQQLAEETIEEHAERIQEQYEAENAALLSLDPKTGQILAMVGSRDYFSEEIDGQVNVITRARQPGSSLKPLVYAAAFAKGFTPNTILYDIVTNFDVSEDGEEKNYSPRNYNDKELGPVTIRKALAGSLNVPAVKAIYLAGIDNVIDIAEDMGYTTLKDKKRFGLSLVLGGAEVKMIEHANAYSAFAREGELHPITYIMRIEDKNGRVIEEYKEQRRKTVMDPKIARLVNDILSDNNARAYAFGYENWLTLPGRPVAAKTGTTNDYRDAWTLGYTPSLVTGVWVGNNDNRAMQGRASGGRAAAPIWRDYMQKVLGATPIEYFKKPDEKKTGKPILDGTEIGVSVVKIDKVSGLLATELTPEVFQEEKIYFTPRSILAYIDKNDPLGPAPTNPQKDSQFKRWEEAIANWTASSSPESLKEIIEKSGFLANSDEESEDIEILFSAPPNEYDNLHVEENKPQFWVETPQNNQTINDPLLYVNIIRATAPRGISRAEYYIDGQLFFTNTNYPFNMAKNIGFLANGIHNLKIQLCDDIDNCSSREIGFNLALTQEQKTKIETSLKLLFPQSGLALNKIDFPLTLQIEVGAPEQVNKIIFYKIKKGQAIPELIGSLSSVSQQNTNYSWAEQGEPGEYHIYAEARMWDGQIIRSASAIIAISN